MGVAGPAVGTIINGEITAEYRSTMLSIQSMVSYIGVFAGSLLLGGLAQQVSIRAAWLAGSLVLIALLLPYLRIDRLYRNRITLTKAEDDQQDAQLQTI
jgi:MFS family permease